MISNQFPSFLRSRRESQRKQRLFILVQPANGLESRQQAGGAFGQWRHGGGVSCGTANRPVGQVHALFSTATARTPRHSRGRRKRFGRDSSPELLKDGPSLLKLVTAKIRFPGKVPAHFETAPRSAAATGTLTSWCWTASAAFRNWQARVSPASRKFPCRRRIRTEPRIPGTKTTTTQPTMPRIVSDRKMPPLRPALRQGADEHASQALRRARRHRHEARRQTPLFSCAGRGELTHRHTGCIWKCRPKPRSANWTVCCATSGWNVAVT